MNREERKIQAEKHFEYTQDAFRTETEESVYRSEIFRENSIFKIKENTGIIPNIEIKDSTSENAVRVFGNDSTVLNFASYTRPGGGFIKGSIAQEEALCHASNLYDILVSFTDEYNNNYKDKNKGMYYNWAIYSPRVQFIYNAQSVNEDVVEANVITCAAPNWSESKNYSDIDEMQYETILKNRIEFILNICEKKGTQKLILGAFGCGVFENDPFKVAAIFKDLLMSGHYSFKQVMFAIPKGKNNNYNAFVKVFS